MCELIQENIQVILCGQVTLKQRPSVISSPQHLVDISCNFFSKSVTIEPQGKLQCPNSVLPHFAGISSTPGLPSVHSKHSKF